VGDIERDIEIEECNRFTPVPELQGNGKGVMKKKKTKKDNGKATGSKSAKKRQGMRRKERANKATVNEHLAYYLVGAKGRIHRGEKNT